MNEVKKMVQCEHVWTDFSSDPSNPILVCEKCGTLKPVETHTVNLERDADSDKR